jgi:sortase A
MEKSMMKRKDSKKVVSVIIICVLLLVCALTLTIYYLCIDTQAGETAEAIEQELRAEIQEKTSDGGYAQEAAEDQPLYVSNPETDMPVMDIDGHDYTGILEIPVLDISLPVMSQWSYSEMKQAPSCYTGSIYMNNMVIAAYNYKSHFGSLNELQPGDTVTFTDTDDNLFCYEVKAVEELKTSSLEEVENNGYDLTLVTCNHGGKAIYTVRCSLINIY